MTVITRWEPFRELAGLSRWLQDASRGNDELISGTFVPATDVYEDEHSFVLKFEVPGMEEKDLDLRLENNTLTVRGV